MMMTSKTLKHRLRREARIRENYDRIAALLSSTESTKFAARHPTRVVPDVNGKYDDVPIYHCATDV